MSRVLFAASAALALSCSFAMAQSTAPTGSSNPASAPAKTPATSTVTAAPAAKPNSNKPTRVAAPPAGEVPKSVASCLTMLHDIGPKVRAAKMKDHELAELQIKGATAASLCHQSKYKEAVDAHAQILASIAGNKK